MVIMLVGGLYNQKMKVMKMMMIDQTWIDNEERQWKFLQDGEEE